MSSTLVTERTHLRDLLRDTDAAAYTFSDTEINRTLVNKGLEVSAQVGEAQTWALAAFSISAGSAADIQLPTASIGHYDQILALRIVETGNLINRVSLQEVERLREGQSSGGDPYYYALYEDPTSKVFVRFGNVPGISRTVDVFRAVLPTATYTDTTAFPFSDLLLSAIRKAAGAELVGKMADDKLAVLALSRTAASGWLNDVRDTMRAERERRYQLKRAGYGIGAIYGG